MSTLRNEHGQRVFLGSATRRAAHPEEVAATIAKCSKQEPQDAPAEEAPAASTKRNHKDGE